MITSKNMRDNSAVTITGADFVTGGLPQDSNVRPNRLFTAETSLILHTTGRLSMAKIDEVIAEIIHILSHNEPAR
jgi:mRNA interferase MazF